VVILQPSQDLGAAYSIKKVEGLPNVHLAHIAGAGQPSPAFTHEVTDFGRAQCRHISDIMAKFAHLSPLFWAYNPNLAYPFARLPAVVRAYHATENYFDFSGFNDDFYAVYRAMIQYSDLVVSCSDGVYRAVERETRSNRHIVSPNGCDFDFFSYPGRGTETTKKIFSGIPKGRKIAVFAGNINRRIDFDLVLALAKQLDRLQLLFVGPLEATLSPELKAKWRAATELTNVTYQPEVSPNELPYIYSKSTIGIIPYLRERLLVENGFPLKALEMGAAGLPVISTLMKPLATVANTVSMAENAEEFISMCEDASGAGWSRERMKASLETCRSQDYALRFPQILQNLVDASQPRLDGQLEQLEDRTNLMPFPEGREFSALGVWMRRSKVFLLKMKRLARDAVKT
jgi:glycosyltransferase involved in cell wall biosynthesis